MQNLEKVYSSSFFGGIDDDDDDDDDDSHDDDDDDDGLFFQEQFQFALAAVAEEVHAILKALPQ